MVKRTLDEIALDPNPTVYFNPLLMQRMNNLNIADLIYLAEKGANLFANLQLTDEAEEILNSDEKLSSIIKKWG